MNSKFRIVFIHDLYLHFSLQKLKIVEINQAEVAVVDASVVLEESLASVVEVELLGPP